MRRAWIRPLFALIVVAVLLAVPAAVTAQPAQADKQPTATGRGGAAATVDVLATRAAVEALRDGANAIDAAVVAAAVLGVTEPFSCGIGGGGFMVIRTSDGKVTTIDHRERAPAAMRPDSFFEAGQPLAFNDARYSGLSAGVPGTVRGWEEALRRYGTMSVAEALGPAIQVARDGFVVDQTFVDQTQQNLDYFDDVPSTQALYLDPDGTPRDVGTVLRNPDLARTYERIAHLGAKGFYGGAVADAMVEAVQHPPVAADANHTWRPGVMTMRDVKAYVAPEREPTRVGYRGLDVYSMGPPSSGGSTVGEALNILEGFGLDPADRTRALHLYLEASRFSFADRNAYLADPDFFDVPLTGLLSDGFAAERRTLIDPQRAATSPVPPGDPYPYNAGGVGTARAAATATQTQTTTHLTVSDRAGNVVAYTFTIESTGGNGVVVPGLGVPAQQRADRLQLRLADPSQPGRGWQAAPQLDEPHDRARGRPADPGAWLAGRLDHHHRRAAAPPGPARPGRHAPAGHRGAARQPAQHSDHPGRARLRRLAGGAGAGGAVRSPVLDDQRDRRRHRHRAARRRPRARRCRAGTPRRR